VLPCRSDGRSARRSGSNWCCEPAWNLDPGAPRHHRLSLPAREARTAHSVNGWAPRSAVGWEAPMDVVYERCCGLDIHKKTVVACRIVPGPAGKPTKEIRTFGTMTEDLLALSDWLASEGVTHVAMESTGVYWKPIYNLLEGSFELLLANARHIKAVPGRKTDVRDCEWIADLLRHGLLKPSFVPDRRERELRELARYRSSLVRERTAEVNRLQKTLEGANIKLAAVASDLMGASGREMLAALVGGSTDATALAQLARGKLRQKLPDLGRALAGRCGAHQRFLLARQLAHIDFLDEAIEQVSAEVRERVRPFEAVVQRLDTIPGAVDGRGDPGRDRHRHGPLPRRRAPGLLGGDVPGEQRERRQAQEQQDPPGQPLAAGRLDRGRAGRRPHQRHLPRGPIPPAPGPAGQEEGDRRGRPHHPRDRLPPAHGRDGLSRPRRPLLR
jgi:transposase